MKQIIQMFFFDVKLNTKSFMAGYMIIVPMAILLILRTFIPSVESASINFAVVTSGPNAVTDEQLLEKLDNLGEILEYESVEAMEQKLMGIGKAEGLYRDPDENQYVSLLERTSETNTVFSYAARYIRQQYFWKNYPDSTRVTVFSWGVPEELSNRTKTHPVATIGGSIVFVFLVILMAFIIGLGVVTDKEYGTDMALKATPVSKADYFTGKSIFPLLILCFYTFIALLILGLLHVNILQTYVTALVSYTVALLFGLLIGALGKNEVEAIGVGKVLSVVIILAVLGGILFPTGWKWVVWWAPFYWMYDILREIFTETAAWTSILWKCGVILGETGIIFLMLRKKIIKGLS